jgi:hypothetical protein
LVFIPVLEFLTIQRTIEEAINMNRSRYANLLVFFILVAMTGCAGHDIKEGGQDAEVRGLAHPQYADVHLDVKHINKCVYEVVVPKPADDSITYEKPLPMDQLPFQVRNDKYLSIGTAFACSGAEFATAAHVMNLGARSRFKEALIRDGNGNVFSIDKIVKYSSRRDFVVFTVKGRQSPEYFETTRAPEVGGKVFTVGNALGQGVVIRDGLYTSNTPEEIDGNWNWIRFSAAASPGNSGGPLLDSNGRVIGMVLLKSPNENLNYALPIDEVNRDYANSAEIFFKGVYSLEIFDFAKKAELHAKISLPMSCDDFKKALTATMYEFYVKTRKELLAETKENTFPNGSGSNRIMSSSLDRFFPQLLMRSESGSWELVQPKDIRSIGLDNNGRISFGLIKSTMYVKIDKPDNISLRNICYDSKASMDFMLKALNVIRPIGQEKIRITSLGKADSEYTHTDAYGRKWLVRTWPSFLDQEYAAFILPTPDGCVVIMKAGQSGLVFDTYVDEMKILTDFITVSYTGTFKQWQEYLQIKDAHPSAFNHLEINLDNSSFAYKSNDLTAKCDSNDMKIGNNNILALIFGYRKTAESVTWDVSDIWIGEGKFEKTEFGISRHVKPKDNDEKSSDWWQRVLEEKKPFDRQVSIKDDTTTIRAVCKPRSSEAKGDGSVLYSVRYTRNGTVGQDEMQSRLDRFMKSVLVK